MFFIPVPVLIAQNGKTHMCLHDPFYRCCTEKFSPEQKKVETAHH